MARLLSIGLLAAFFFSSTFVLNRAMSLGGGHWVWSVYTPYATEESTGLPASPQAPGAPWIMRPGTASSHIMVVQPREEAPSN